MLLWLQANLGSIAVIIVLACIVALIIHSMRKDRKQGKCSCGGSCSSCGGCSGCAMSGKCHG